MKKILYSLLLMISMVSCMSDESYLDHLDYTDTVPTVDGGNFEGDALKFKYGKKGVCFTLRVEEGVGATNMAKVKMLNAKWNYSWGTSYTHDQPNPDYDQPEYIEFVPQFWGGTPQSSDEVLNAVTYQREKGMLYRILGANEPDKKNQANKTVDAVIESWKHLESLGVPIGSPAVAQNPMTSEWFIEFWTKAMERGLRVDYVCVHDYGGGNFEAFRDKMTAIYEKYQRPLLITEFAPTDWGATTIAENSHSPEKVLKFMQQVLPWMEETEWIAGYSWYSHPITAAVGYSSALFNEDWTELTPLGEWYANFEPGTTTGPTVDPDDGYGDNLIKNSDFEYMDNDWVAGANNDFVNVNNIDDLRIQIIDGETTLRLLDANGSGDIMQTVGGVTAGATYEYGFTGRIQAVEGASGSQSAMGELVMTIKSIDGSELASLKVDEATNKVVVASFTLPEDYAYDSVEVIINKESGIGYVDNTTLREKKKEDDTLATNMVVNGDFESLWSSSDPNWKSDNPSEVKNETYDPIAGTNSIRLAALNNVRSIYQTIDVEAGKTYRYGFVGRCLASMAASGAAEARGTVSIKIMNGTNVLEKMDITSATDKRVQGNVTIPDGVTSITLKLEKSEGTSYMDNVHFNEGAGDVVEGEDYVQSAVALTSINLSSEAQSMTLGSSALKLTYTIEPANANDFEVAWSISAGESVTVDASGAVTAVKLGESIVKVTATKRDGSTLEDTCVITVSEAPAIVTGNLVKDAGFEGDVVFTKWVSGLILPVGEWMSSPSNFNVDKGITTAYEGENCVRFSAAGKNQKASAAQWITVEKGATYRYGYAGKTSYISNVEANGFGYLYMIIKNGDDTAKISSSDLVVAGLDWTKSAEGRVTIPADYAFDTVKIFIGKDSGICSIDDIYFERVVE